VENPAPDDVEARSEFERQQFQLYEARRLSTETYANAVIAATLVTAAVVVSDFGRAEDAGDRPGGVILAAALLGLLAAFGLATIARVVSWETRRVFLGVEPTRDERPDLAVRRTLDAVRDCTEGDVELRRRIHAHWRARADSTWRLDRHKGRLLRWSLVGFAGPLIYFAARLLA